MCSFCFMFVANARTADAHFAAISQGARPQHRNSTADIQHIISYCLRYEPERRPSAHDLLVLLRSIKRKRGFLAYCLGSGSPPVAAIRAGNEMRRSLEK